MACKFSCNAKKSIYFRIWQFLFEGLCTAVYKNLGIKVTIEIRLSKKFGKKIKTIILERLRKV